MTRITRTLTAAGLALSIAIGAVGASATPARANNDDAVAIIGGLIALYAIGQALQNDNRNVTVTRNYGHRPPPQGTSPSVSSAARGARALLHRGERPERLFPRLCPALHAEQRPPRVDLLPQQCLRRVETQRGPRMIYGGRCLAQNGWVREAGFRP
jgi:hypothetical protein